LENSSFRKLEKDLENKKKEYATKKNYMHDIDNARLFLESHARNERKKLTSRESVKRSSMDEARLA
jgi:hypothetical protein